MSGDKIGRCFVRALRPHEYNLIHFQPFDILVKVLLFKKHLSERKKIEKVTKGQRLPRKSKEGPFPRQRRRRHQPHKTAHGLPPKTHQTNTF